MARSVTTVLRECGLHRSKLFSGLSPSYCSSIVDQRPAARFQALNSGVDSESPDFVCTVDGCRDQAPLSAWTSLREGNERFVNHASMPSTTELFRTASSAVRSSVVLMGSNEGLSTVDELEGRHVVETGSLIMQRSRIIADKNGQECVRDRRCHVHVVRRSHASSGHSRRHREHLIRERK